jgi:hypothetical protein
MSTRESALKSNYEIFTQFSNTDKVNAYREFSGELLDSYWIDHKEECEQSDDIDALAWHLLDTYLESDEDYGYEQLIEIVLKNKENK